MFETEAATWKISQSSPKNTCTRLATLSKKAPLEVLLFEFYQIFQNSYSAEHIWTSTSISFFMKNVMIAFVV